MKSFNLKKTVSLLMAVCFCTMSVTQTLAINNVKLSKNEDGTMTVTAEGTERFAVAQYDRLGMMKDLGISSIMGDKKEVTFNYDETQRAYIYSYSDFENMKPETKPIKIGNRTVVMHDFDIMATNYLLYTQGVSTMDNKFKTTDKNGKETTAVKFQRTDETHTADQIAKSANAQFLDVATNMSDYAVWQADVRVDDASITNVNSCLRAVEPNTNERVKKFHYLWVISPYGGDDNVSMLKFGNKESSTIFLNEGEWYTLAAAVDFKDHKVKYYIDGVYKFENGIDTKITYDDIRPQSHQVNVNANDKMDIVYDNICVYEGTEPREDLDSVYFNFDMEKKTIVTKDETKEREALAGCYAVHTRSGVAMGPDGKKVLLKNKPYKKHNNYYVNLKEIKEVWDLPKNFSLPYIESDGYAWLNDIATELGLITYTPKADISDGLVVLAEDFKAPSDLQALNDFMLYYRPSKEEILDAYKQSDVYKQHPRLWATQEDFDRIREEYESGTDENIKYWGENLIRYADGRFGREPKQIESAEGRVTEHRQLAGDMHAWGMAYHLTGDEKYVREAVRIMRIYCEVFPNWHPQAHLDIVEAMAGFAIGYDWMYHAFTDEERKLFEKTMYEQGYQYCYQGFLSNSTPMGTAFNNDANHGTVCNGSVTQAALAFMDVYPEESAWFVANCIRGNEYNMYHWNTGAWFEGPHYWEYTVINTVKFLGCMDFVLGTDFGFGSIEGLSEAGISELSMHGNCGIFNYGDASPSNFYSPEFMWMAEKFDQPGLGNVLLKHRTHSYSTVNRSNGEPIALSLVWYKPEYKTTEILPELDYFNNELDIATSRNSWDSNSTFVAIKGGRLYQAHSQLDAGSFIFESDGIRWFRDLGASSYESDYWDSKVGGKRWKFFNARAEAHNTVVTNPTEANEDMDIGTSNVSETNCAELSLIEKNDNGIIYTVDMSDVLYDVTEATRGFFMTDNKKSLVVRDEITIPGDDNIVYWHLMPDTNARVSVDAENDVITLTRGTKGCKVEYKVEGGTVEVEEFENPIVSLIGDNILGAAPTCGRIRIKITGVSESCVITAKITPNSTVDPTPLSDYTNSISTWRVNQ